VLTTAGTVLTVLVTAADGALAAVAWVIELG
jgi:hypothetical protein